jgi:hypothetical protein
MRFADKQAGFTKMKNLFLRMAKDINKRRHFYMEDELLFFDMVIAAIDSADFENKYLSLILDAQKKILFADLRHNIINKHKISHKI